MTNRNDNRERKNKNQTIKKEISPKTSMCEAR